MKIFLKRDTGLTLVALVVTIIVLLILAGVTIGLLLGDNGILTRSQNAHYTQTKATIEQEIELSKGYAETYKQTWTGDYLDKVAEYLNNDNILKSISSTANASKIDDYVILRVGDEFNYKITETGTIFLGNKEESEEVLRPEVVDLKSSNIEFSYNPSTPCKGPVEVTITLKDDALALSQKYSGQIVLRYKIGQNGNWQDYTGTFNVNENCVIYPALYNGRDYSQTSVTGEVSNIDKDAPTSVSFTIDTASVTENSIRIEATASDDIGIKYFDVSTDGGATYSSGNRQTIATPTSGTASKTITLTGLNENTEYTIKVKAIDVAGNETESTIATAKTKLRITQATIGAIADQDYTGQALTPEPTITYSGTTLTKNTDYALTYNNNTNAGTATITITGIGQCIEETSKTFTIKQKSINDLSLAIGPNSNLNENQKIYGERFNISYNSTTKMNNIRITGGGGWEFLYIPISTVSGKSYTFTCDYKNISGFTGLSGNYSGIGLQACKSIPTDSDNVGNSNAIKTEYLPKEKNTTTRTYSLTFTATGSVTYIAFNFGMCSDGVPIQVEIGNFKMNNNWAYKYDGSAKKVTEQVKHGDKILTLDTDYSLSYTNNTNAGTATVTVTGKGNYSGTKSVTFKINS